MLEVAVPRWRSHLFVLKLLRFRFPNISFVVLGQKDPVLLLYAGFASLKLWSTELVAHDKSH